MFGRTYFPRHARSLHLGHDDVGQKEVDRSFVQRREFNRLGATGRGDHDVAVASQNSASHLAQALLVVDHEDRLGPSNGATVALFRLDDVALASRGR